MSHAKHLFKGQPLCRQRPFSPAPASPPAIVHPWKTSADLLLPPPTSPVVAFLFRGREGGNQEILAAPIQTANGCESCWTPAQFLPVPPGLGVTRPSLCGQERDQIHGQAHQPVPRRRARWQDIDSLSLSDLKARVEALPARTAAVSGQRPQRTVSPSLSLSSSLAVFPSVSHPLSLTASG